MEYFMTFVLEKPKSIGENVKKYLVKIYITSGE